MTAPRLNLKAQPSLGAALNSRLQDGSSPQALASDAQRVESMPLARLRAMPNQVRREFDQNQLLELSADIAVNGVLQPLVVRPMVDGLFEVVAGERRLRAAKLAGLETVPVLVRDLSDLRAAEFNLLENLNRSDINSFEAAHGVFHVLGLQLELNGEELEALLRRMSALASGQVSASGVGEAELAPFESVNSFFARVQKMTVRSYVANLLPLRHAPPDVVEALQNGLLESSKALCLMRVEDATVRGDLLERCLSGLTLSELRALVAQYQAAGARPALSVPAQLQRGLEALAQRGALKLLKSGRSKLTLEFADRASLERVLKALELPGIESPPVARATKRQR